MLGSGGSADARDLPAASAALGLAGLAMIGLAAAMSHGWFDRHFLPSFARSRAFQWGLVGTLRLSLAGAGLALLVFAWRRRPRSATAFVSILLAVAAAVTATELILRSRTWRAAQEHRSKEPLSRRDALLGWTFLPNHRGRAEIDGRTIDYATDAFGYRVRTAGERLDPARPTIVFAGESILFGYGLQWQETVPAQVQAALGVQTANLSVNAFATDQAYMRLRRELPRFARPAAVVTLFMPILLDRNLDRDRPHLDSHLQWHPARPPPLRLVELGRRLVRYRSEPAIAEGVAMTQAALRATLAAAGRRHARAIIVVPQYLPEDPSERALRRRVLDSARLPYLLVPLDSRWRLAGDRHPDPRGARRIAAAIVRALSPGTIPASGR